MLPVRALRCAENRMSKVSKPTTDMTAPTTSSLRSAERVSHHETETTDGAAGVVFFGAALFFPREDVTTLPFGFTPDFEEVGEGVLRGIRKCLCEERSLRRSNLLIIGRLLRCACNDIKIIAQMVCFSFGVKYWADSNFHHAVKTQRHQQSC